MTLAAAIAAELPFLRAEAEALMVDEFEMRAYGEWRYDAEAGRDVRDYTVVYTTPGRLLTSTAPGEAEAAGRTVLSIDRTLHVPADKPTVPAGMVAHRIVDGAEYRILADITSSHPKSRRFAVEEVLS